LQAHEAVETWSTVEIDLPWPAPRFSLACPDTEYTCSGLAASGLWCAEPEPETAEVLDSLLLGCDESCLYVDVGCNLGYFASLAAAHGSTSECYEPAPRWIAAAQRTVQLNGPGFAQRLQVHHNAVVGDGDDVDANLTFHETYHACGISSTVPDGAFSAPTVRLSRLLAGRSVKLLKMDIDSIEGELLTVATAMLVANQTQVESILVELGSTEAEMTASGIPNWTPNPRGGDVVDLWRLQQLGYDVYRINTHTNKEIYDWKGLDVNKYETQGGPQAAHYEQRFGMRSMRKLELLKTHPDASSYPGLIDWGHSFLITKQTLAEPKKHHYKDLQNAHLDGQSLNVDNPALRTAL